MNSIFGLLLFGTLTFVQSVPFHEGHAHPVDSSFISKGTNELATALLQGFVEKSENQVYSPFGYSAILAVFAEGARGVSREEIAKALYFPENVNKVREAYHSVLERFSAKHFTNSPEFKNWFYIYKNYTVDEDLQNVLRKYYLTEVKTVDRPEDLIKETKKSPIRETIDPDKKIQMEMEKLEKEEADKMSGEMKKDMSKTEMDNSAKDVEVPKSSIVQPEKNMEKMEKVMEEGKVEKDVESPMEQKAEKTEQKMEKEMTEEKKTMEEKPRAMEMMEPEKENSEMKKETVDDFSGMTDNTLKICGPDSKPRLVIFNGLYYKGEWETPFMKMPADDSRVFYKSEKEKIVTSTIHSQGVFNFGNIPSLDCRAIELPYKGGRYSLVVLVPNSRDGLTKLVSDLTKVPLSSIYDQMSEKLVDVCLPRFEISTISKPISAFNKFGLSKVPSIFNPEKADFSGISPKNSGLYVEELVQMVTFKVDAEYSKANFLTASIASSRSNAQTFQVNQPFLFYLRDNVEDIIIVNGKVIDPTPRPHFQFS